ncbi:MAG: carbohydrate ABC transporter permease [Anaerolineales bacterium]|nr:carbohydrate ABC transporter permease [Anaerolineae bacterium]MCB0199662.1 carbohydrate ABC transporter permease [Anaerolineae bacterium]MCB0203893.1 carbohydrate ABC transporter permease [Anaerolineae bacterium]MCB0256100.1 carbohydrate ABC transporter permease [Anaerolineae bacterium]MCB9143703.1 carbohydrate ABC transporter permease [Anaerolineales bacterium]
MTSATPARSRWSRLGSWLVIVLMVMLAISWAVPVIWALVASLRPATEPLGRGDVWFGSRLTLANYARALELAPFDRYFMNTMIIVLMILGVQLITITLAGFAFARYRFPGDRLLFFFILLQLMIPTTALLVPNFATIRALGLYDTRLAIAIPYFGSAFGVFLMRQAFLAVPRELADAGIIDGCNWWQLLRHIYLPPSTPTLIAFGLSSVAWHWNEFLWPLIVTSSDKSRPLTAGLVRFTQLGEIGAQWSLLSAATLLVAGPLFIAFLIFQKRFIQSFLHSGIK